MLGGKIVLNGYTLSLGQTNVYAGSIQSSDTTSSPQLDISNSKLVFNGPDNSTFHNGPQFNFGKNGTTNGTIISGNSEVILNDPEYIGIGNNTFDTFIINLGVLAGNSRTLNITGSPTFRSLTIQSANSAAHTVKFYAGSTTSLGDVDVNGTLSKPVIIRSSTPGSKYTLKKTSGTVSASYLDLQDSNVTGGATWNALYSIDSGNNSGWTLLGKPTWGSVPSSESVSNATVKPGTSTMGPVASIASAESFGSPRFTVIAHPGSVSSAQAFGTPLIKLAVGLASITSSEAVSNVSFTTRYLKPNSITSSEAVSTAPNITLFMSSLGSTATQQAVASPSFTVAPPPPPPPTDWSAIGKQDDKEYIYKVYDRTGSFVGVWTDVKDQLQFTQQINTPGTTSTVQLARSPNTTREIRVNLITQDGHRLITQDGHGYVGTAHTSNSVGEDTDVQLGFNVDVYVIYGDFSNLITQDGRRLITQDGKGFIVAAGAPFGQRVFSGYVMDYDSGYGDVEDVTVTLASHGMEWSTKLVHSGALTTVTYSSTALEQIAKNVIDIDPGVMGYSSDSIQTTGVSTTLKFVANSKLDALKSVYDQSPDGWYWFGSVSDNTYYLKQLATGYDHIFYLGLHIKSFRVKQSIESLQNTVYFIGGEVTAGNTLYKKYPDAASVTEWGERMIRVVDRRYTVEQSVHNYANKVLSQYADPIFTSPLVISSARYDIERIKLGQTIGLRGFGNFVDSLPPLQIVSLAYTPTFVTLQLGRLQTRQVDEVTNAQDAVANEQYDGLPTSPS